MKPYFESVFIPGDPFPVRGIITSTMEHVIQVHPHWHAEVEILYYMNRCALQQVNDVFFTAEPGDIIVIGRDQLHSTYTIGKSNCQIMVIQFDAATMLEPMPAGRHGFPVAGFNHETVYQNPIKTTTPDGMLLKQAVLAMYEEVAAKGTAYEYMVRSALYQFTGILSRMGVFTASLTRAENISQLHAMLEKTFRLVDESFTEEISLKEAAQVSNLSTTHFCRLFKQTTGMTFHEYLTFYRVNRAEAMLDTGKKMTEVAFDCGFGSVTSFIRNFKRFKNCTPSRYIQGQDT